MAVTSPAAVDFKITVGGFFSQFDFHALDDPDFREDSVREALIVPLLKELGFSE